MKRNLVLLGVSCLVALSLVLASCVPAGPTAPTTSTAPTAPTPEEPVKEVVATVVATEVEMVKLTLKKLDGTTVEKWVEKPRYGGAFIFVADTVPRSFDHALGSPFTVFHGLFTDDTLFLGDFYRGPSGTGDFAGGTEVIPYPSAHRGLIAESYELPDAETIIFHIRKGIYWHNQSPVNGRELTAADVVFVIKRNFNMLPDFPVPNSYHEARLLPEERPLAVSAPDKYTVVVKGNPATLGGLLNWTSQMTRIYAPEVIQKYRQLTDWKQNVGNGPFILTDYVPASSYTFVRNPRYWMKDPFHPQNQLPYVDSVKGLIITDKSTQMAALRTGKIDVLRDVSREDAENFAKTTPALKSAKFSDQYIVTLGMRGDKPELPWYDKRVRDALQMAIDREAIVRDYYKGEALILAWPVRGSPGWRTLGAYYPLEELPESVRELFEYKPDKAKRLLAEAGYPQGFKMEVITTAVLVDQLSILKYYWAKIGVDLILDIKESGVFSSILIGKAHKHAIAQSSRLSTHAWHDFRIDSPNNLTQVDDPRTKEAILEYSKYFMLDDTKANQVLRDFIPYALEQAYTVQFPHPLISEMWWPWLKNYSGEDTVGNTFQWSWVRSIWIDQQLKRKMGF